MGSFSYTPDASFSEKLTLLMPVLMCSLCYSLHASFSLQEFLLRLLLLVLQWVSFTSLMVIVLARSSSLDNWPETKNKQTNKNKNKTEEEKKKKKKKKTTRQNGWGIYIHKNTIILVDQLYASLQIIIHSLPTVVSNCFLLFITWKTNSEPFRHRRLNSCFSSVLILLDMTLTCGSAPNSRLAYDSFTLEQYMHAHAHTLSLSLSLSLCDIQWIYTMDSILEIYSMRQTDRETDRQTDRHRESCTVLTTDGVFPHQTKLDRAHSPNPAFLTDVVQGRCGWEFNLIKF